MQIRDWQLQHAKARLSELIREVNQGPHIITRRGHVKAVVISFGLFEKLVKEAKNAQRYRANELKNNKKA